MLHDSLQIFQDHRVLGTGLGTLQEVFPLYETFYDGLVVNHSHNDYAEALAETGVDRRLLRACLSGFPFLESWKILNVEGDPRSFAYHAGALVACLGLLVHAGVDFNFHIPSNALIFLLQSALATSAFPALPLPRGTLNLSGAYSESSSCDSASPFESLVMEFPEECRVAAVYQRSATSV